jgi:hypothetical protein
MNFTEEKDISDDRGHERSSSPADLEDCPLTGESDQFPRRRRRWLSWPANDSFFWRFYSLFMTAISMILLATAIHGSTPSTTCPEHDSTVAYAPSHDPSQGFPHPSQSWDKQNVVATRFFRDLRYMSLDPETDYLWKEHLYMATGNIQLPDGKGNTSLKGIAMYVRRPHTASSLLIVQVPSDALPRENAYGSPACEDWCRHRY